MEAKFLSDLRAPKMSLRAERLLRKQNGHKFTGKTPHEPDYQGPEMINHQVPQKNQKGERAQKEN